MDEQLEGYYCSGAVDMKSLDTTGEPTGWIGQLWYCKAREMAPIYTHMNNPDPRSFARGNRGLAGRIVFYKVFNEDALIKPFDIIISAANEYGALATMKVLSVELMDKGYLVEQIEERKEYTYICKGMTPWENHSKKEIDPKDGYTKEELRYMDMIEVNED